MIQFGVVEAVEKMYRARAGSCRADTESAGELRETHCFEGGHLLVTSLDELWVVVGATPGRQ
ncbi:Uncharacterised protein [Mycobacteroides abscessus subsp. abscessus]|nr:Uncharacterised protein [Mycobacteroides abscessus subsp. abscessus]